MTRNVSWLVLIQGACGEKGLIDRTDRWGSRFIDLVFLSLSSIEPGSNDIGMSQHQIHGSPPSQRLALAAD